MATLTKEEYLKEFKKKAKEIYASKDSTIKFFSKIGVLNKNGTLHKNYTQTDRSPVRPN